MRLDAIEFDGDEDVRISEVKTPPTDTVLANGRWQAVAANEFEEKPFQLAFGHSRRSIRKESLEHGGPADGSERPFVDVAAYGSDRCQTFEQRPIQRPFQMTGGQHACDINERSGWASSGDVLDGQDVSRVERSRPMYSHARIPARPSAVTDGHVDQFRGVFYKSGKLGCRKVTRRGPADRKNGSGGALLPRPRRTSDDVDTGTDAGPAASPAAISDLAVGQSRVQRLLSRDNPVLARSDLVNDLVWAAHVFPFGRGEGDCIESATNDIGRPLGHSLSKKASG